MLPESHENLEWFALGMVAGIITLALFDLFGM